jgi:beta-galactosidase
MKHVLFKKGIILLSFILTSITLFSQELYVGTNYHPHDLKNVAQWSNDIKLMKDAGFKVVRMGHLAWDSYEPSEGHFDFDWFDKVMDMMNKAGIKVILDIAVRPAPVWLHHKYPSIDVTDEEGHRLYANSRYMEDVGDPMYQKYALQYADALTKHYAHHPALLAFGIDNESGAGVFSFSETVQKRFISWLREKYLSTDSLNVAWATQRWSRRINDFDEVGLPALSSYMTGSPEKVLDFRRFLSDEIVHFLLKVIAVVNQNAPKALTNTNAWYFTSRYFDYAPITYSGKLTREGCGFYPGGSLLDNNGLIDALFGIERIQYEQTTPFWCNEFLSMNAVPGAIRKSAYASLLYGNQMVCGWTWQSMHNGEEQYLEGLLDWDGQPSRRYEEYKQIATEFKKIEKYFPYQPKADIALAFSFPSQMIGKSAYPERHDAQVETCFKSLFYRNVDSKVIDISRSLLKYKLVIIPGYAVMTEAEAHKIRSFIKDGGTVIMTGNSDVVDEHGKVYNSIHPANLNDVFGIRIGGFEEIASMNELSKNAVGDHSLTLSFNGTNIQTEATIFDVIQPKGCDVLASITSMKTSYPIITSHSYGKGKAIYVGLAANDKWLTPLFDYLLPMISIQGPNVPQGVLARQIDKKHILYLNTTNAVQCIQISRKAKSLLNGSTYEASFNIQPNEPEFIEIE